MMTLDNAVSYRVRQEAFVSNLNGTSMAEIVLVSIPMPLGLWLLSETKVRLSELNTIIIISRAAINPTTITKIESSWNKNTLLQYAYSSFILSYNILSV